MIADEHGLSLVEILVAVAIGFLTVARRSEVA